MISGSCNSLASNVVCLIMYSMCLQCHTPWEPVQWGHFAIGEPAKVFWFQVSKVFSEET